MIVTLAIGFLLDPLPKVNLTTLRGRLNLSRISPESNHNFVAATVRPGRGGHREFKGHADAGYRHPIPVEKGQTRLRELSCQKRPSEFVQHQHFPFSETTQAVWLGTCIASILLGLDLGLAVGLGVELISVVLRTQL